jgi:predicted helicase
MTPLETILAKYRSDSMTEREKGTYFEELIRTYFRFEATYADLYSHVWLYADWVKEIGGPEFGFSGKDTGIDIVAKTRGTEEYHAIQCKCYADNLGKELPRIPAVKTFADFRAFSQAGRDLAHWHLNYETVECCSGITVAALSKRQAQEKQEDEEAWRLESAATYRVTKMKFAKKKDPESGKSINDKTTIIYNEYITLRNIPLEAYDYVVNGKPALEWVMERQSVTTDKDSGITNDANLWATETMGNPKYPLELFLRVVTVSVETNRIVANLPRLDIL